MSILYDPAQQAIAEESLRVLTARHDLDRLLALLETTGEFDRDFWVTAKQQGWTGLTTPEAYGGLGLGLIELGLVAQATGRLTAGAPFLTSNYGAERLLLAGDDQAARQDWLPRLAAGEAIGALALCESGGWLPVAPTCRFRDGRLDGEKLAVVAGLAADFAVVWAASDDQPALALVDLADVERRAVTGFDNSRLTCALVFADTPARLLLAGDRAQRALRGALAHIAVVAAHEQLGGAEALMTTARDYAEMRKAFGQPIGAFQSVKHRIAELYGLVEIARANCVHAAASAGEPDFFRAAAAARLTATEAYDTAARDATQIHGAIGVTWEAGLHLHMRRARSLAAELGSMLIWEDWLAADLIGEAA